MAKILSLVDFGKEWLDFTPEDISGFDVHDHCPVCGSSEEPETAIKVGTEEKPSIDVCVCKNCSSVYYKNPPSFEYIENYYAHKWRATEKDNSSAWNTLPLKTKYVNILNDLNINDKSCRIFDLGVGGGGGLNGLKQAGFENIWGIEASQHRAEKVQQAFPGRVEFSLYENYKPEEPFDIVFSNHVVEHTFSPYDAFKWMMGNTKDDALIVMCVPDATFEPVPGQILFLPHLHSISPDAVRSWGEEFNVKVGMWKNARMDDMCVVFVKGNPGFISLDEENYNLIENVPKTGFQEVVSRLKKPWTRQEKRRVLITYGQNHRAKTEQQRIYGYETLQGVRAFLFKALCAAYTFARSVFGNKVSNHFYFFITRFAKIGPETLEFRYMEILPDQNEEQDNVPNIYLKDGRTALMIK